MNTVYYGENYTHTVRCRHVENQIRRNRAKARRGREIRRNIFLLLAISIISILCMSFYLGFQSKASEKQENAGYKYYTSTEIPASGLEVLIDEYYDGSAWDTREDFKREVLSVNKLPAGASLYSPAARPGNKIIIPYYSAEIR